MIGSSNMCYARLAVSNTHKSTRHTHTHTQNTPHHHPPNNPPWRHIVPCRAANRVRTVREPLCHRIRKVCCWKFVCGPRELGESNFARSARAQSTLGRAKVARDQSTRPSDACSQSHKHIYGILLYMYESAI